MRVPIVIISFQDHSGDLEGHAEPYSFLAIGAIVEETKLGYVLAHWVYARPDQRPQGKLGDVTTYIAKVKGMKVKRIGTLSLKD